MAKIVNWWHAYSNAKFTLEKRKCACGNIETWEHVLKCKNQELTFKFLGKIAEVNLKHDVPAACKMTMHKGLKQCLTGVHIQYAAGESVYSAKKMKASGSISFAV